MERATKLFVVGWTGLALGLEVWFLRGAWPGLPLVAAAGCAAAAALALRRPRAIAVVLVCAYVFPVLVHARLGNYHPQYGALWMALLYGAILPQSVRTSWHGSAAWRGPLICWALVVVAGASLVAVREVDFTPALIHVTTVANTGGGGWPAFIVGWVLHVALVLVMGVLWFDWLLASTDEDFHRSVATPLAVSGAALALVAIYQLFVDLSFLNLTVFGSMARATGTFFDANVSGAVAALWVGGVVVWAQPLGRWRVPLTVAGVAASWLTVWASGSRTAFVAAAIVTLFSIVSLHVAHRETRRGRFMIPIGVAAAGVCLLLLANANLAATGPLQRLWLSMPSFSADALQAAARENLWTRNGYGTAATAMIQQFPWFGVGVGSFQSLLPEFAARSGLTLVPDNAQNWYRHQVAELGIIGSAAWMAWVVAFGCFVVRRRREEQAAAWTLRGVLVAFAAISFVGMPGQDLFVAVTFWTMAAWYAKSAGLPATTAPLRTRSWVLMAGVLAVFAAGTVHAARTDLRVPVRAQRGGWPYTYGFYPAQIGPDGIERRWTSRRAVAVVPAKARWLAVTVSVDHRALGPGAAAPRASRAPTRPISVKVWVDRELILDRRLTNTAAVTEYVRVDEGQRFVMLETWASRVMRPREFGVADDREVGMLIEWSFADRAPAASLLDGVWGAP